MRDIRTVTVRSEGRKEARGYTCLYLDRSLLCESDGFLDSPTARSAVVARLQACPGASCPG